MIRLNSKRKQPMKRMNYTAPSATQEAVKKLRKFYEKHLGTELSTSLIIRRAVEVLSDHVGGLT
ncbi:hypothetical protein ADUPG1_003428, partial [Aduncisulcus paluster]